MLMQTYLQEAKKKKIQFIAIVMAEKPVIKNRERERDLFGPKCTNLSEARVKELEI